MYNECAEILAVGTEITTGKICNTNAQYISSKLYEIGIDTYYHSVVPDNYEVLYNYTKTAMSHAELVIITGGLGPTLDDFTKETVSEVLGKKLIFNKAVMKEIQDYFNRIGKNMPEINRKQAYFPEGSILIPNGYGTAPGCIIETLENTVVMLPGPPREMIPMFDNFVIPYVLKKCKSQISSSVLNFFGIGESELCEKIRDFLLAESGISIATYVNSASVSLRIWCKHYNDDDKRLLVKSIADEIAFRLREYVFSSQEQTLQETVGELLISNNLTISIAESCTGGLISSQLISIPGISKVFERAVICYSNSSKIQDLSVDEDVIQKYGAVSRPTAIQMSKGVRCLANTDIGLSVTGIAGPQSADSSKPIGLVYISITDRNTTKCEKLNLVGDRDSIRQAAAMHALNILRKHILEY